MSDTQKLKIGFIGTGNIARGGHLNHLSRWDDVDLVAFCDIDEEAVGRAVEAYGGAAYTRAERMLDEVALDAVYVCLPPFAHTHRWRLMTASLPLSRVGSRLSWMEIALIADRSHAMPAMPPVQLK